MLLVEPVVAEAFNFIFKVLDPDPDPDPNPDHDPDPNGAFVLKVVVIVLLLKMVLAIVFESYKNVKKKMDGVNTVQDDFRMLGEPRLGPGPGPG